MIQRGKMKIEKIKDRINELIVLADKVIQSTNHNNYVDNELFNEFRTTSLSFLRNLFGEKHPYFKEFDSNVSGSYSPYSYEGRGILRAVKKEIDGGWIFTLKGIISAEIFSDFLEMAEYLLNEGFKDPAAVMIGSVLEEHLRQLCKKQSIDVEKIKDGKAIPKKADLLNSELASVQIYNKLDQKSITSWLDLRNKAAHGKYDEYAEDQVKLMYQGISNFMIRIPV